MIFDGGKLMAKDTAEENVMINVKKQVKLASTYLRKQMLYPKAHVRQKDYETKRRPIFNKLFLFHQQLWQSRLKP